MAVIRLPFTLETATAKVRAARAGRRSVPQIFIGEMHVGGYDDLAALDRAGRLDGLLRG